MKIILIAIAMFFIFAFTPFAFALPAFATNTYTRTPSDASATNPLSFHYDYTNWDTDVLPDFNGSAVDFQYMLLHVTDGVHQYNSGVIPCADAGGVDSYCASTDAAPKSIDFTATLATGTAPYTVRLCGSGSSSINANGYFTAGNSCITYGWFQTAPMNMLSDSFTIVAPSTASSTASSTTPNGKHIFKHKHGHGHGHGHKPIKKILKTQKNSPQGRQ